MLFPGVTRPHMAEELYRSVARWAADALLQLCCLQHEVFPTRNFTRIALEGR